MSIRRSKPEFTAAAGTVFEIVRVLQSGPDGLTDEELRSILGRDGVVSTRVKAAVRGSASVSVNIDKLVGAAQAADNPKRLTYVNAEVTEANFATTRPLRSSPMASPLSEIDLSGVNSHSKVVATIDAKRSRPTMAEVLIYAVTPASQGGWDGESTVWFILDSGRVGCLCRHGADRRLSLYDVGIDDDWGDDYRVLVFGK